MVSIDEVLNMSVYYLLLQFIDSVRQQARFARTKHSNWPGTATYPQFFARRG